MQHLRITSPSGSTDAVIAALSADPAVTGLSCLYGAALAPVGDVVEADLPREALNDVLDSLRATGVHHEGTVQILAVTTWVSDAGLTAEQRTPGSSADSVVWEEVSQHAYQESELNWTFLSFMVLATLIAAVALILDSQLLIIGAMVLGPEFYAVIALGLSLVRRHPALLRRAMRALMVGFGVAICVVTLAVLAARGLGWVGVDQVTGARSATAFVHEPDKWSFIVAVIAATAGALSLTSARIGGLSGVFISVTTIPAAANVALGIAFAQGGEIRGSLLQLLLNLAGMALAGWLALAFHQAVWSRVSARRARLVRRWRRIRRGTEEPVTEERAEVKR
ncbi:MAG: DUF389 domain-containing protein [Nocardioidaceae bacterium]|nr:DUF389 domain-containing protein [Nocardioidaceae bacterium]